MQIVPMETICMKCQILFSGENEHYFNVSSAKHFTPSAESALQIHLLGHFATCDERNVESIHNI